MTIRALISPPRQVTHILGRPAFDWFSRLAQAAGITDDLAIDFAYVSLMPADLMDCPPNGRLVDPDGRSIASRGDGAVNVTIQRRPVSDARSYNDECLLLKQRINAMASQMGVHLVTPTSVIIEPWVTLSTGVIVWPGCTLRGTTMVAKGAEIRPNCWIEDSTIGAHTVVQPGTVCLGANVGPECKVGPMAHLRPGAQLDGHNKVGNFVEVKKARLHPHAQASHLTYLGDADIGTKANIGAGTITCNYDGYGKYRTVIGAGAFIGSNTALVAPVEIGEGAIVGAGSVITKSVPADSVAIERSPQRNLDGRAPGIREKNKTRAGK